MAKQIWPELRKARVAIFEIGQYSEKYIERVNPNLCCDSLDVDILANNGGILSTPEKNISDLVTTLSRKELTIQE